MFTNDLLGKEVSRLGFGAMRLPLGADGRIDEALLQQMIDCSMAGGINYYDTAYVYHSGFSETALRDALKKYPRDSYYLANKFPGHVIADSYDCEAIFKEQLERCGTDYFDFYLLHNVYENSVNTYMDPRWNILEFCKEQKRLGRIRHLGLSTHARPDTLERFLDYTDGSMEFCQIQLNYMDWTLQQGNVKYEMLEKLGLPLVIMEPLRGGKLASMPEEAGRKLKALRPEESFASWSFRYLMNLPNVKVVLSGMSDMAQLEDNLKTFSSGIPQTAEEKAVLEALAEEMQDALPCTRCRYCCDGCPMELDIPMLIHAYNDLKYSGSNMVIAMQFDAIPPEKQPDACIGCGACSAVCPQGIDIPAAMAELPGLIKKSPNWAEVCRQREEERKRIQAGQ
ncbi:MAG: aldo/keto reductase [Lachnospiraceae bacterium]|nr:aldo/keto reductase [Lachnospiraceae bacterium]